jgi:hypothetical protein
MRLIHQEAQRKSHQRVESSTAAFFICFSSLFTSLLQLQYIPMGIVQPILIF